MAQVEGIFREIEDMCFLKTAEGMKSVMRTEFTVVEAIMQASGRRTFIEALSCRRYDATPSCAFFDLHAASDLFMFSSMIFPAINIMRR